MLNIDVITNLGLNYWAQRFITEFRAVYYTDIQQ
jgi:hypothetical protein